MYPFFILAVGDLRNKGAADRLFVYNPLLYFNCSSEEIIRLGRCECHKQNNMIGFCRERNKNLSHPCFSPAKSSSWRSWNEKDDKHDPNRWNLRQSSGEDSGAKMPVGGPPVCIIDLCCLTTTTIYHNTHRDSFFCLVFVFSCLLLFLPAGNEWEP